MNGKQLSGYFSRALTVLRSRGLLSAFKHEYVLLVLRIRSRMYARFAYVVSTFLPNSSAPPSHVEVV